MCTLVVEDLFIESKLLIILIIATSFSQSLLFFIILPSLAFHKILYNNASSIYAREKPVIAYSQKTWKLNSGEPMHAESGYWRPKPDGTIEVVIAQSTGLVEVQKGSYDGENKVVKLHSEVIGNASKVKEISRVFTLVNEELTYVVEMATNLNGLQPHLKASLKKL